MKPDALSLEQFCQDRALTMKASPADHNPHMANSADMDHWRCTISGNGRKFRVTFSMGRGHNGKAPTLPDVLSCLASDASGYENARDLADFCAEYGYDTDSRKAEKTYRVIGQQAARLRGFLGDESYSVLLYNTESL